ncbi:MAG TPA: glycosyltransferase [Bryobacteraceae bacterium]|nr:glycosyltransferase [Bryobacteraceae bacterium]
MEEIQPPPKVSAVVASWNNAAALRRCLGALERSTGRENMEVVVVDCGSHDESPLLDAEFPKITMLRLPRNFGIVKALNIGMRTAKGDYYLFLPPEVEVQPDTVAVLVAQLEATAEAAAVAPLLLSPEGDVLTRHRRVPLPDEAYRAWRAGDFADWTTPACDVDALPVEFLNLAVLMARANFLKGMRYIDERYGNSCWDLEVCCQIRRASKRVLLLRTVSAVLQAAPAAATYPAIRAQFAADRVLGIVTYAGKHFGLGAGMKTRLLATLSALGAAMASLVTFRDTRYCFSLLSCLLSSQKIDGSQSAF